jgi:hypothetical protein
MSPRLKRIALVFVTATAGGALTLLRGQYGWLTDALRIALTLGLVAVLVITQVIGQTAGRRAAMKRLLGHLHARSWGKDGGRDPDFRVSFYAPGLLRRRLNCYYRTDGRRSRKSWCQRPTTKGCQGVVGHVWLNGLAMNVRALPSVPTDDELEGYLTATFVDRKTYEKLSWRGSAMHAIPVVTSAGADPAGVLLVECRTPDSTVQPGATFAHDAVLCGMVWEGWV